MGLVVEVMQEILAGNGLRYPNLANAKYICWRQNEDLTGGVS